MKYIFTSVGGSGSTALVKRLEKHYSVDSKPDTYFVEKGQPFTHKGGEIKHQFLNQLDEYPQQVTSDAFFERTGFSLDLNKTIEENLVDYIKFIQSTDNRTVLFNSLYKFNFFSRNEIDDLVCLVRHPLDSYLSYVKPERHANLVKGYGGPEAKESIRYFARNWNANTKEALRLRKRRSIILRYEYIKDDLPDDIKFISENWSGSVNDKSSVNSYIEDEIYRLTYDNYFEVYEQW